MSGSQEDIGAVEIDISPKLASRDSLSAIEESPLQKHQSAISIKEFMSKTGNFVSSSIRAFDWNGVNFRFHASIIIMVIIDMVAESYSRKCISGAFYALLRNLMLLMIITAIAFARIALFGKKEQVNVANAAPENVELGQEKKDVNNEDIALVSATIMYFGHVCKWEKMCDSIWKRIKFFAFTAIFHCILGILCLIAANGEMQIMKWFAKLNFYCMVMCLLPIKGFDGGEMIKIYFNERRGWNDVAVTALLFSLALVVTAIVAIYAFCSMDVMAFVLAIYCGIKIGRAIMDPNDRDVKTLKLWAKKGRDVPLSDLSDLSDVSGTIEMNGGANDAI